MTDVAAPDMPAPSEDWDSEGHNEESVTYPEFPGNPHNHRFTISMNGQGPMVVVRGNTAEEIKASFEELDEAGVGVVLGQVWNSIKSGAALGQGGAQQVSSGPPAPAQAPPAPGRGPAYNPQLPPPQAGGQAPAAWQNAGAPPAPPAQQWGGNGGQGNARGPKPRPDNWGTVYKIDVPYQQKDAFRAYREQYKDAFKGKVAWAGGGGYWIHGDVVQSFANYSPVPA